MESNTGVRVDKGLVERLVAVMHARANGSRMTLDGNSVNGGRMKRIDGTTNVKEIEREREKVLRTRKKVKYTVRALTDFFEYIQDSRVQYTLVS